jgi:protein required for attachment to host cells
VALGGRGFVSVGAVVACCALATACTSEPASTSTPSPTSAATTPAESQIERQMRLDYEAAEEAYRDNIAEQDRLARAGGVHTATSALKSTAEGGYLSAALASLAYIERKGWHGTGSTAILGVVQVGWQQKRVRLMSCEDGSRLRLIDKSGKDVTPNANARFVQSLSVIKRAGRWRVSSFESKSVKVFEGEPCTA